MISKIYDYIIIGAGPSGCIAAAELRKKGASVLIFEKEERNSLLAKCCGDGISFNCIKLLRKIGFPIEQFELAGAMPIKKYYYMKNQEITERILYKDRHELAYGCPRNVTNAIFRQYAENSGAELIYNKRIISIDHSDGYFNVSNYFGREIICASGTSGVVRITGECIIKNNSNKPFGISTTIKGKVCEEGFFLFDFAPEFKGKYGWIFTTGADNYNVGIWLDKQTTHIKEMLYAFIQKHSNKWLGGEPEFVEKIKGGFLGIGNKCVSNIRGVSMIGDLANTCDSEFGEGISRAVASALKLVHEELV